jgi:phosphoribosylglycinamide formyltransferase-1
VPDRSGTTLGALPLQHRGVLVDLAVLVSGSGTNLAALLRTIDADPEFGGRVVVVGSDKANAGGLALAREAGIPVVVEELGDHADRPTWERALTDGVAAYTPEVVVLAGFMKIVSSTFLSRWPDRVLNTHPSILPAFPGAHAVREALAYGVKVTGSTVHIVDEQVDHGPIIAQRAIAVRPGDTEDDVHERIKAIEHELFPACIRALCRGELVLKDRHVVWSGPQL